MQRYRFPKRLVFPLMAPFVAALIYGFVTFPDAPLERRDGVVRGRNGAIYTAAQYRQFQLWERALIVSFALVFAGMGAWFVSHPPPELLTWWRNRQQRKA